MTIIRWLYLVTALAISALAPAARAQETPRPIDTAQLEPYIDGLVKNAMAAEHLAGVTLAIVQGGKPILLKGYGIAGTDPQVAVDPHRTLFRIGSVSKTFTWIAVMQAAERREVRLTAPIDDYLPATLKTADRRFRQPIRMIDLMSHAPGYENNDLGRLFEKDPAKVGDLNQYLERNRPARVRPPARFPTYSNYGTGLAAHAIARQSGLDFERLVEERITGPLGMTSTTFREPGGSDRAGTAPMSSDLAKRMSNGFVRSGGRFAAQPFEHIMVRPAGSASSTAADMARFMLAMLGDGSLDGASIYGPETARAFRTAIFDRPHGVNGWAHGFQQFALPGGYSGYGHGGATQFFMSGMTLIPELDLGIFISVNTSSGGRFAGEFADAIVSKFYSPPPAAAGRGDPQLAREAERYGGAYLNTRRADSGLQSLIGHLVGAASVTVTPDGQLVTSAGSTKRWLPDGKTGTFKSTTDEDRILFEFDADGKAARWLTASGTAAFERVAWTRTPTALLLMTALTFLASLGTLIRRMFVKPVHDGVWQSVSAKLALAISGLWIAGTVAVLAWLPTATAAGEQKWPGELLVTASALMLLAAIGTLGLLLATPLALRSAVGRGPGWSRARKVRHVILVVIFVGFAALLQRWGALSPWDV